MNKSQQIIIALQQTMFKSYKKNDFTNTIKMKELLNNYKSNKRM